MTLNSVTMTALPGVPLVAPGDDIADIILTAADNCGQGIQDGDVLIIAQKIISKAEGRYAFVDEVEPSARAVELGKETDKDPRMVELVLSESKEVLRHRPGVIIVVHRLGLVMANAGIDASNVDTVDGRERVLLLPLDSDETSERLRAEIKKRRGVDVGIVINDSFGRAWRTGTVGVALGAAGIPSVVDLRGNPDLFGRPLQSSIVGFADELAAAGSVLQGQADEGMPVVLMRGLQLPAEPEAAAGSLIREPKEDLFR